jgi:hypothetical protein
MMGMKLLLCFWILATSCAWADEAIDREAIEQQVSAFNNHTKPPSDLFTAEIPDSERTALLAEPMSEVSSVKIVIRSVRFITPEVAMVDCTNTRYGSAIVVQTMPVLLVVKKDGTQWKIASLRVFSPQTFPLRTSK